MLLQLQNNDSAQDTTKPGSVEPPPPHEKQNHPPPDLQKKSPSSWIANPLPPPPGGGSFLYSADLLIPTKWTSNSRSPISVYTNLGLITTSKEQTGFVPLLAILPLSSLSRSSVVYSPGAQYYEGHDHHETGSGNIERPAIIKKIFGLPRSSFSILLDHIDCVYFKNSFVSSELKPTESSAAVGGLKDGPKAASSSSLIVSLNIEVSASI